MPHIQILGTGGTIASRAELGAGAVARDGVGALLPRLPDGVTVATRDVFTTGSYRLGLADLRTIAEAVEAAAAHRPDGIVVTHGTDTLEETAFLVDLVHASPIPVVFTGAQRPADDPATDGPRNLVDAVRAAADPRLRGAGALVAFDGVVRGAAGLRKAHTTASDPFAGGVEVARFVGDDLEVRGIPARRAPLPAPAPAFDAMRVDVVVSYPGATPDVLEQAAALGARAVVLAGTGVGNAGPGFAAAVARLTADGIPVILGTRVPWGPVVPVYGNGGGVDIIAAGAISAGPVNPYQARILAALVLADGGDAAALRAAFDLRTPSTPIQGES